MTDTKPDSPLKKFWPLAVLGIGLMAFYVLDLGQWLSFDSLREHRAELSAWVGENTLTAATAFILLYIVVVAFSLPGGSVMTIGGGFLLGPYIGASCSIIGATIGATLLFLAARTALGDALRAKAGPWLKNMEAGFRDNAMSYLLVLRLVPIFPFFIVNLVPAFLGVGLSTYIIATFFGIIPGTFVFSLVGNGLGAVFDAGGEPDLGIIFKPSILAPLIGLALLAMIPVIYKKYSGKKSSLEENSG